MLGLQRSLFEAAANKPVSNGFQGFEYRPEFIGEAEEAGLLTHIRELPFREFEFHGYTGKRRIVSFGWKYDFASEKLREADEIPQFLLPLRSRAASFINCEPEAFEQALVTEYGPGAGIGWHRDKAVFGEVVGISLLSPCILRFRHKLGTKWERANVSAEQRSAYHLTGPVRALWEHSILRVDALRYSITFRTMRDE